MHKRCEAVILANEGHTRCNCASGAYTPYCARFFTRGRLTCSCYPLIHESGNHDTMMTALPSDSKQARAPHTDIFAEAQLHCYLKRRLSSLIIQPLPAHYLLTIKPYAISYKAWRPFQRKGYHLVPLRNATLKARPQCGVAYNCPDMQTMGVLFCGQQQWNENSVV